MLFNVAISIVLEEFDIQKITINNIDNAERST